MSSGATIFQMISGIGDSFSKSYEAGQKKALASDLGEKVRTGDYAGAADLALKGGDLQTGLALAKLGEGRGANQALADSLAPLFGGGGGGQPGLLGSLTDSYRGGGGGGAPAGRLPAFAGGDASMRAPGSGGEIETRFVNTLKTGGLTNPYGLSAMAAYANRESGYKPGNITGSWSDPSESGQPGTSGGILSWRGDRFANMRRLTAGAADPIVAQAKFALTENPQLTMALQNAKSAEEANSLMANAWRFAGFDRPGGGEHAARLGTTRAYLASLGGQPAEPTRVAAAAPPTSDAANRPADGARSAGFFVPPGWAPPGSGASGIPTLGRPGPSNTGGPGSGSASAVSTGGGSEAETGTMAGPARAPRASAEAPPTTAQLASAGVPAPVAAGIDRMTPGSPQRVQALIRASMISGLSDQGQNLVKTLLAHEMQQSVPTSDQREYAQARAQGFRGTFLDYKNALRGDKPRTQIRENDAGQAYVVDPDNADAEPRLLNIPNAGVRVWGEIGPDGQTVQPPPNVAKGAPGYYDAKGVPQLITGKGTQITNTIGAGESEESKNLGKLRAERAEKIEAGAMRAPDQLAKLNLLDGVLERARTGTFGPAEATVVGLAQSLGIPDATISKLGLNPQQATSAQAATKLINESVVGMIGGGGFPSNNFSNNDLKFLNDIFPKVANQPEANRLAIEVMRRTEQRKLEFGDAWAEYQQAQRETGKPVSVAEFEFNFRKSLRDKPDLFADLRESIQRDGFGAATGGRSGGEGGGAAAGGTGAGTAGTPRRFSGGAIRMEDAQALKGAEDTPENRAIFDERYGEGAAGFVLKRPLPQGGAQPDAQAAAPTPRAPGAPTVIPPRAASALRSAPDTAENRAAFDQQYGEGAAMRVLRRPPPAASQTPTAAAPMQGARQGHDGNWYVPDPARPGQFLQVQP